MSLMKMNKIWIATAMLLYPDNEKEILKLGKDEEGELAIHISSKNGNVGWFVSKELKKLILKEWAEHLGGDFMDEFDPFINKATEMIHSCNRWY